MSLPNRPSICPMCVHLNLEGPAGRPRCKAFPQGIPDEILHEGFDHREPFMTETVLFELDPAIDPAELQEWEDSVLDMEKQKLLTMLGPLEEDEELE